MCSPDPATIGASIAAAQFVMGAIGGNEDRKQAVTNAKLDYRESTEALQARSAEVNAQYSEDAVSRAIESAKTQGRIAASVSEGGFGKGTIAALSQQEKFGSGRDKSLAERNLQLEQLQIGRQGNAAYSQMKSVVGAKTTNPLALMGVAGASLAALGVGASK